MVSFLLFTISLVYLLMHYRESENKTGPLQIIAFVVVVPSFFFMIAPNSQPKAPDGVVPITGNPDTNFIIGHTYIVDKVSFFSDNEQNMIEAVALLQSDSDKRAELENMKWSGKILLMPKGVHVEILSENNHLYKVKILDGFYKNNIAYINWTSLAI